MYHKSLLYISSFNLMDKIPKSAPDSQPAFTQCGIHSKFGSILGLSLTYISSNCTSFCNLDPSYLHEKLLEMGSENIIYWLLTSDAISEVCQYDFDMDKFSVTSNPVNFLKYDDCRGIAGLEVISNALKAVNIKRYMDIREIISLASKNPEKGRN